MPERDRLNRTIQAQVFERAPYGKWVVVRVADGELLGVGDASIYALRNAKANYPELDLDEVAVVYSAIQANERKTRTEAMTRRLRVRPVT
jgi:hypothetical protein